MKQDFSDFHASIAAHDDQAINPSRNAPLRDVIDRRRRGLLKGGLGLAGIAFSAAQWPAPGLRRTGATDRLPEHSGAARPAVRPGRGGARYSARVFFSWGDPVLVDAPQWQADASDDWQAQLKQAGDNHDGMHFSRSPMRRTPTACW